MNLQEILEKALIIRDNDAEVLHIGTLMAIQRESYHNEEYYNNATFIINTWRQTRFNLDQIKDTDRIALMVSKFIREMTVELDIKLIEYIKGKSVDGQRLKPFSIIDGKAKENKNWCDGLTSPIVGGIKLTLCTEGYNYANLYYDAYIDSIFNNGIENGVYLKDNAIIMLPIKFNDRNKDNDKRISFRQNDIDFIIKLLFVDDTESYILNIQSKYVVLYNGNIITNYNLVAN